MDIHDKHMETVLCAMFAFCEVTDPADSDLYKGELMRKTDLATIETDLRGRGLKAPAAKPLVCGITQSALMAEGFLSAASFQRTTHVLAEASLTRRIDEMTGLKENVIVGQTIPVTGDALAERADAGA